MLHENKPNSSAAIEQNEPARPMTTYGQWGQVIVTSLLLLFAAFGYFESVKPAAEKQWLSNQVADLRLEKHRVSKYIAERTERLPQYVFEFYWKKVLASVLELERHDSSGPPFSGSSSGSWTTNFEEALKQRGIQVTETRRPQRDLTGRDLIEENLGLPEFTLLVEDQQNTLMAAIKSVSGGDSRFALPLTFVLSNITVPRDDAKYLSFPEFDNLNVYEKHRMNSEVENENKRREQARNEFLQAMDGLKSAVLASLSK